MPDRKQCTTADGSNTTEPDVGGNFKGGRGVGSKIQCTLTSHSTSRAHGVLVGEANRPKGPAT